MIVAAGLFILWPGVVRHALAARDLLPANELGSILAHALALPLWIASVLLVFQAGSDTRPYQLGLHGYRAGVNVLLGVLAWVAVTPLTYLVLWITVLFTGVGDEHPLQQVARQHRGWAEVALVLLSAVVAAPVSEEVLFRGILQPWFSRRRWGGATALGLAFLLAFWSGWSRGQVDFGSAGGWYHERSGKEIEVVGRLKAEGEEILLVPESGEAAWRVDLGPNRSAKGLHEYQKRRLQAVGKPAPDDAPKKLYLARIELLDRNYLADLAPALFVLALGPVVLYGPWLLRRWIPDREAACGLLGTAVLFAAMHSSVWPSPVPLFVLALALGWLAYRTQSLVAPLVLHALFNAVACVQVLLR